MSGYPGIRHGNQSVIPSREWRQLCQVYDSQPNDHISLACYGTDRRPSLVGSFLSQLRRIHSPMAIGYGTIFSDLRGLIKKISKQNKNTANAEVFMSSLVGILLGRIPFFLGIDV